MYETLHTNDVLKIFYIKSQKKYEIAHTNVLLEVHSIKSERKS